MSVYGSTSHKGPQRAFFLSAFIKSIPFSFLIPNWKLSLNPANDCNKMLNALSCWHVPWPGTFTWVLLSLCWLSASGSLGYGWCWRSLTVTPRLSEGPVSSCTRLREETVEGHGGVTINISLEAFEKLLALPILVRYQCSAMRTEKLSRGRSVESFSQVKHGNISFLLTQESGSHLCEVALSYSRHWPFGSLVSDTLKKANLVMKHEQVFEIVQSLAFWPCVALRIVVESVLFAGCVGSNKFPFVVKV